MQTLSNGQNKASRSKFISTEPYAPNRITALQKIKQLKRQLKVAEKEHNILKEAMD
ncbi:hypothetical protein M0N77_03695 [Psychrobacter sp. AH5]